MICCAFLALVAVAAAYNPDVQLAKWNPRNVYSLAKICDISEKQTYNPFTSQEEYEPMDTIGNVFGQKPRHRREWRQIRHCCNKMNVYEKKECLKDVRENVLDNYCDKGLKHICCKSEYENRYTCFSRQPFRQMLGGAINPTSFEVEPELEGWLSTGYGGVNTGRLAAELPMMRESQMMRAMDFEEAKELDYETMTGGAWTTGVLGGDTLGKELLAEEMYETDSFRPNVYGKFRDEDDMMTEGWTTGLETPLRRYGKWADLEGGMNGLETEREIIEEEEEMTGGLFGGISGRRSCVNNPKCHQKIHYTTSVGANKVCGNNVFKSSMHQTRDCCKAGALVGKVAGPKNTNVCLPALYKFDVKTRGCVPNKPRCKQAFVQCCQETAERVREQRVEKDLVRESMIRPEIEEALMVRGGLY